MQNFIRDKLNKTVMSFVQLPTWMDALRNFLPSKVEAMLSRNTSVHLLVPPEGRPMLTVNSYKMMLGSAVGTQLQPWLINTKFPPLLQLVSHLGITGTHCSPSVSCSLPFISTLTFQLAYRNLLFNVLHLGYVPENGYVGCNNMECSNSQ